jgi:hypothetical protein
MAMMYSSSRIGLLPAVFLAVGVGLAAALASIPVTQAEDRALEGSWSGGGEIVFPSGATERARCRASFQRKGGESFGMSAVCATSSARVQQHAEVTRVSSNRYRGEFFNQEYGLSGNIRIVVNGNSLVASLSGGGGAAQFSLRR